MEKQVIKITDQSIIGTATVLYGAKEILGSLSLSLGTHRLELDKQIRQFMRDNDIEFDDTENKYTYNYVTNELTIEPY